MSTRGSPDVDLTSGVTVPEYRTALSHLPYGTVYAVQVGFRFESKRRRRLARRLGYLRFKQLWKVGPPTHVKKQRVCRLAEEKQRRTLLRVKQ